MAQHQVTHDNETLEEKEQKIQDFLDMHGLTILGAPKVRHQEANVIIDDIRYPLEIKPTVEVNSNVKVQPSKYDGVALTNLEDTQEYADPVITLVTPRLNMWINTYHGPIPANIAPQTGMCLQADELKSYDLTIARKTGFYKITILVGDTISILTYDGDVFKTYVGKVINFYLRSVTEADSKIKSELFIVLDTSPEPFESHVDMISIYQIVDVGEPGVNWDISEYGVDIRKRYYDWLVELRQANNREKPVVIAPSGNIKTKSIPPLDLRVTTFEEAGLDDSIMIMATVKVRFVLNFIDDNTFKLYTDGDVINVLMVDIGYALMPAIIRNKILYFIPVKYLSFWNQDSE